MAGMAELSRPRTLLVFAHPALERGCANWRMAEGVRDLDGVTFHDLYEVYPDFAIDVPEEQQRLADHDLIVLQFPLYWYSGPALLKEWLDLVWLHGFAYGETGRSLEGKILTCAVSTGWRAQTYGPDGQNCFTLDEFLRPFEQTARLCRMRWAAPFALHGAGTLPQADVQIEVGRYREHLERLAAELGRTPVHAA
jgi:glutathione-regulated potassium-efflux system ancillary protein KefG